MKSTVSERGQVTIPKSLRTRLGIRPGQVVEMSEERGRIVLTKAATTDPVDEVYGILEGQGTSDDLVRSLRGEPDAT